MTDTGSGPRVLFIGGSLNQTTQMHQIARELPECQASFTPFYADGWVEAARRLGLVEFTILGDKLRRRCLDYLERERLSIDLHGRGRYDLVLTCSDLLLPKNLRERRVVLVQEGILDPPSLGLRVWRRLRFLPRYLGGTATTGLSLGYEKFCVASDGYREHFIAQGVPEERLVVTGIPNFDDCRRYLDNDFPHRGYVLVCTSDARETFKREDRRGFIETALLIAKGRPLFFKLHPNENVPRATREIERWAPGARVFATGSAEHMIANCEALLTTYSSTAFVALALGKQVYSNWDLTTLERLLPEQNGSAPRRIAAVCRQVLAQPAAQKVPARRAPALAALLGRG